MAGGHRRGAGGAAVLSRRGPPHSCLQRQPAPNRAGGGRVQGAARADCSRSFIYGRERLPACWLVLKYHQNCHLLSVQHLQVPCPSGMM